MSKRGRNGYLCGANAFLDQGEQGTCSCYAFTQGVTSGLCNMYNVAIDPGNFVTIVKDRCPSWNGNDVLALVDDWNKQFDRKWIEDLSQTKLFMIRIKAPVLIEDFDEACAIMNAAVSVLHLVVVIKLGPAGSLHELHAVAAFTCYDTQQGGKEMTAVNSWPKSGQPTMTVTASNFCHAFLIEPEITNGMMGSKPMKKMPQPTRLYKSRQAVIDSALLRCCFGMAEKSSEERKIHSSIIPRIVEGLRVGEGKALEAAAALRSLAVNETSRFEIEQKGAIPLLVSLLSEGTDEQKVNAAGAVRNLAKGVPLKVADAGAIRPLVALLNSTAAPLKESIEESVGALGELAGSKASAARVWEAVEPLVALLRESVAPTVLVDVADALRSLALNDMGCRMSIVRGGAVPPLVRLLDGTVPQKVQAAGALENLALYDKNRDKIVAAGAIEPLVKLLKGTTAAEKEHAKRALGLLGQSKEIEAMIASCKLDLEQQVVTPPPVIPPSPPPATPPSTSGTGPLVNDLGANGDNKKASRGHGICSVCGATYSIKKDGTLRAHGGCEGSNKRPRN